jgi:hypothetical protein
MHPLDLMKTRYQAGLVSGGVLSSFKSVIQKEGVMGLYKGYVPVVSVVSPRVALQFTGDFCPFTIPFQAFLVMTAATLLGLQFFKSNFTNVMPQWFLPIGAGMATGVVDVIFGLRSNAEKKLLTQQIVAFHLVSEFCFFSDYAGNGSVNSV